MYNQVEYTRERVCDELKSEKYPYTFYVVHSKQSTQERMRIMDCVDEVWCFGNCEHLHDYKEAVKKGKDKWTMG